MSEATIRVDLLPLLPRRHVANTEETYRSFCLKLMKLGIAQGVIGTRAGHEAGWATKWLKYKQGTLKPEAIDGLNRYFDELARTLEQRPSIRHSKEPPHLERKAV